MVNKYDLSDFTQITGNKFVNKVNHLDVLFLSKETIAFSFDFYSNKIIKRKEKIIEVPVSENGICIGIITWIKVNLYQSIYWC